MKRTLVALLLVLFAFDAQAQIRESGGKYVLSDSTRIFKVKRLEQDSALTPFSKYVPFYSEVGNSSNWMGGAYYRSWYAFTVDEYVKVDSIGWYFVTALATTDSFIVGIYRMSDSTRICQTPWGSPASSATNLVYMRAVDNTVMLAPGTAYAMMWSHNTNSTLPSVPAVQATLWYDHLKRNGLMGRISSSAPLTSLPATLSSDIAFPGPATQYAPIFILKRNGTP